MLLRPLRLWLSLLALVFAVGCYRADANGDGLRSGDTDVLISAKFEKRLLGPTGWNGIEERAARYCYAEVRDAGNDQKLYVGYLDMSGKGLVNLPFGMRVYLALYATVEVPSANGTPVLRGSARLAEHSADPNLVRNTLETLVVSRPVTVGQGPLNLTVSAIDPITGRYNPDAGAFNIVDQMVTFGRNMDVVEYNKLKLPHLHAFWSPKHGVTSIPSAVLVGNQTPLLTDNPHPNASEPADARCTFTFAVRGNLTSAPDVAADAFNDSILQKVLCHSLFEAYSWNSQGASVLRCDNANDFVSGNIASEPSIAFVNGFCDFLSCAFRKNPTIQDVDNYGAVRSVYLDRPIAIAMPEGGEFYSWGVGASLYGIWKNVYLETNDGWWALYDATQYQGTGEFLNTTLACYPTYLQGLHSKASPVWGAMVGELSKQQIGDVTSAAYFNSGALWTNKSVPFQASGTLTLVDKPYNVFDLGAQKAYHILHSGSAPRRLTLTFPAGRDMIVDVYDTKGWINGTTRNGGGTSRQLDLNLGSGEYLVRVRAGYDNTYVGSWNYTLSLQ